MRRPELQPYLGTRIAIQATVRTGEQYGNILQDVILPNGQKLDHAWVRDGYDIDLTEIGEAMIRCTAEAYEYWQAGRDGGKYIEYHSLGDGLRNLMDVKVLQGGIWVPLRQAASAHRRDRLAKIRESKRTGIYIWPGAWTCHDGQWLVRAAKSAVAGSRCVVRSREGYHDRTVSLRKHRGDGIWDFDEIPAAA